LEATWFLEQAMEKRTDYLSYLLRLWRVSSVERARRDDSGQAVWRASLQETLSGDRTNFASLDDLVAFLQHQICDVLNEDEDDDREARSFKCNNGCY
jgi:hypothetical protein